ncbi:MAG: hypothetical protein J1D85_07145 [Bacteroidales bacterium]|nr:hypothetical protein [Bacteroidales bacterium]
MERRKVLFYVQDTPDAGFMDYPEGADPKETKEGYYVDVVHEPYMDSSTSTMTIQSKILIEGPNGDIISILPKQLVRFVVE